MPKKNLDTRVKVLLCVTIVFGVLGLVLGALSIFVPEVGGGAVPKLASMSALVAILSVMVALVLSNSSSE